MNSEKRSVLSAQIMVMTAKPMLMKWRIAVTKVVTVDPAVIMTGRGGERVFAVTACVVVLTHLCGKWENSTYYYYYWLQSLFGQATHSALPGGKSGRTLYLQK